MTLAAGRVSSSAVGRFCLVRSRRENWTDSENTETPQKKKKAISAKSLNYEYDFHKLGRAD